MAFDVASSLPYGISIISLLSWNFSWLRTTLLARSIAYSITCLFSITFTSKTAPGKRVPSYLWPGKWIAKHQRRNVWMYSEYFATHENRRMMPKPGTCKKKKNWSHFTDPKLTRVLVDVCCKCDVAESREFTLNEMNKWNDRSVWMHRECSGQIYIYLYCTKMQRRTPCGRSSIRTEV